jgi:glycerate dehydrogenase
MQIVVTDGYALNPGDLSWDAFRKLGELVYYDRTPADLVTERCKHAAIIITNKTPVNKATIQSCSALKLITVAATGYNIVDVHAAKERNIPVCNVPVYGTDSVAQHTIALLLELTNHVGKHVQSVANGEWSRNADWCYSKAPIIELSGKTLGIVGYGRMGKKVAAIARALGMQVIINNKGNTSLPEERSLQELFQQSDFISLHCPLTENNKGFINMKMLQLMKPTAYLINTSRGPLIHEQDLADALQQHIIAGAALDVLSVEPPPANHPLIGIENCLITPHNAWISFEARKRLMDTTLENVKAFLAGKVQNVVNS